MGRTRRPYLPGGVFHLAARTLGRERLFRPLTRTAALHVVARVMAGSDARLLAVAIMPTHLHLVLQQGAQPLSRLMQPLLRRLALLLQRDAGREGPIFWRPYACQACMSPAHARNAIVYTHLNPVRARLCPDPAAYGWTSHGLYTGHCCAGKSRRANGIGALGDIIEPAYALPLFATGPARRIGELREDYQRYVAWRLATDRRRDEGDVAEAADASSDPAWDTAWGNLHWGEALTPLFHASGPGAGESGAARVSSYRPGLHDVARTIIASRAPDLALECVKGRGGSATHVNVRHAMIRAMAAAGHRNVEIAAFLRLSESAVSKVLRAGPAMPP